MSEGPATASTSSTSMAGHTRRVMVLLPSWPAGPHPLARVLPAGRPHSGRAAPACEPPSCVSSPGPPRAALGHHGLTSVAPPHSGTSATTWAAAPPAALLALDPAAEHTNWHLGCTPALHWSSAPAAAPVLHPVGVTGSHTCWHLLECFACRSHNPPPVCNTTPPLATCNTTVLLLALPHTRVADMLPGEHRGHG